MTLSPESRSGSFGIEVRRSGRLLFLARWVRLSLTPSHRWRQLRWTVAYRLKKRSRLNRRIKASVSAPRFSIHLRTP